MGGGRGTAERRAGAGMGLPERYDTIMGRKLETVEVCLELRLLYHQLNTFIL